MRKSLLIIVAALLLVFTFDVASAQLKQDTNKRVSGNVQNIASGSVFTLISSNSNYSILQQALIKTKLDITLTGTGPFTVFAPVNAAFNKLTKTKSDSLMRLPTKLAAVLKGHIVSGRYTKNDLVKLLIAGKGTTTLNTMDGHVLTFSVNNNKNLLITDFQGNTAEVATFDIVATNDIVHSINSILIK